MDQLGVKTIEDIFMVQNNFIQSFLYWLQSTEMFARPSKQLPGKWQLFEYYTETKGELINIKENELQTLNHHWTIELMADRTSKHQVNLFHIFNEQLDIASWLLRKNFITFQTTSGVAVQFQFAVTQGQLKLLKKDEKGAILFFGFFTRIA